MSFVEGLFATDEELEEKYTRRVDLFEWLEATGVPGTPTGVCYYRSADDIPRDAVHHSELCIRMVDPMESVEEYDHNMAGVALASKTLLLLAPIPRGYTMERVQWESLPGRRVYMVTVYK